MSLPKNYRFFHTNLKKISNFGFKLPYCYLKLASETTDLTKLASHHNPLQGFNLQHDKNNDISNATVSQR